MSGDLVPVAGGHEVSTEAVADAGYSPEVDRAQRVSVAHAVETIRGLMPDWTGLEQGFDALPGSVHWACFQELAVGRPGYAAPASTADVERFASTPEGAALVSGWGPHLAPQKLGILRTRMARALDRMSEADEAAALRWFNALPGLQARALMLALAL